MELSCNTHVSSFVKGSQGEYDDLSEMKAALNLDGDYTFEYTYPLSCVANFQHKIVPNMTGEDLLEIGKVDYENIYAEEDSVAGDPGNIYGMLNRAQSDGPYGIWGHSIDDLYFEGLEIDVSSKTIRFVMGS